MHLNKWGLRLGLAALVLLGALACRTADFFVAPGPGLVPVLGWLSVGFGWNAPGDL